MADVLRDAACEVLLSEKVSTASSKGEPRRRFSKGSCGVVPNPSDFQSSPGEKDLDILRPSFAFAGGLLCPILPPGEFGALGFGLQVCCHACGSKVHGASSKDSYEMSET